jgi:hypothetical protein
MNAVTSVRETWARQGVLGLRAATSAEIAAFEERYSVVLPPVVREYFATVNGTRDGRLGMEDEDQIGFWHLDQVEPLELPTTGDPTAGGGALFVFADWLIDSWRYAFRLTRDHDEVAPVFVSFDPPLQVATSFSEFLERYLARDMRMLFPA